MEAASRFQVAAAASSQFAAFVHGGVASGYFYFGSLTQGWSEVANAASATTSAFSSLAANASTWSQWNAMQAGFERTRQDWQFRSSLADYDRRIARREVSIETDGVRIAEQERTISDLQADSAECNAGRGVMPLLIRSAMDDGGGHPAN